MFSTAGFAHAGRLLTLMFFSAVLAGCVTTGDLEPRRKPIDLDQAQEKHVEMGLRYLKANNRDSARYHFQEALKLDKRDPAAMHGFALVYQAEGEKEVAEQFFKKALRADSRFSMARVNYGVFLYGQGRFEDAYEQFRKASDDLDYNRRSFALTNLGRSALKLGNRERAEGAFTKALALEPGLTMALIEMAELKFEDGAYSLAKRYLDQFNRASRPTPRSLLIGIRIEQIFGNRDREASYALALKNLYPYSQENLEYQRSKNND